MKTEKEIPIYAIRLKQKINALEASMNSDSPLIRQLQLHRKGLEDNIRYLENKDHAIAFIGAVGVGKTTAICHLLGLVNEKNEACLSTSSGRTTLCEVEIRNGERTRILIDPISKREVEDLLVDFVDIIQLRHEGKSAADGESLDLPTEIERCLRNMMELPSKRTRKLKDGTRSVTPDRAMELFETMESDKFFDECLKRLNLGNRTRNTLEMEGGKNHLAWIRTTFEEVNHGRHKETPIPRRIVLEINTDTFSEDDFDFSIIDTKGLDGNVEREDIDQQLNDSRTLAVFCTKFNDAPELAIRQLLQHTIACGLKEHLGQRTVILALDRKDEAIKVMAEDGPVEDAEDGRAVREGQMIDILRTQLGLDERSSRQIIFYNAEDDDGTDTLNQLINRIKWLRESCVRRIDEIGEAINEIEQRRNQSEARAAFQTVAEAIRAWATTSREQYAEFQGLYKPLVDDMTSKEIYASSLRASVNRKGVWNNFDFYYKLSVASKKRAVSSFEKSLGEIRHVLDNLLKHNSLRGARVLIRHIQNEVEEEMQKLHDEAAFMGRKAFEDQLKGDPEFWDLQQGQWGQGPGYKNRIAQGTETWFQHHDPASAESLIRKTIMERWLAFIGRIEGLLKQSNN